MLQLSIIKLLSVYKLVVEKSCIFAYMSLNRPPVISILNYPDTRMNTKKPLDRQLTRAVAKSIHLIHRNPYSVHAFLI